MQPGNAPPVGDGSQVPGDGDQYPIPNTQHLTPITDETRDFLRDLFPRRAPDERVEVRVKTPKGVRTRSFAHANELVRYAEMSSREGDVYFGCAFRRMEGRTAGDVTRLGCVWADLDVKDGYSMADRWVQIEEAPIPPTHIVASGGGFHCYWRLAEPLNDLQRGVRIMQGMEQHFHSDAVHDVARVLRVPGTLNHKYTPPREVRIVRHSSETIVPANLEASYLKERLPLSLLAGGNNFVPETLNGVPEGQRDTAIFKLVTSLHRAGVPMDFAAALVRQAAANCTPPFPEEDAIRKVLRIYRPAPGPDHGFAFSATSAAMPQEASIAELIARPLDNIEYLPLLGTDGYFVRGWSHLVAGYPRSGKTELLAAACSDWAKAGERVLYVSEESVDMWARRAASRKLHTEGYKVVMGLGHPPDALFARCFSGDEGIVVIDTLRNLLGLKDETDNSQLAEAINPWVSAARQNEKTLIIAHHTRKGGGKYGEGIAGGHGLLGMFDIAMEVLRDPNKVNRRLVRAYCRLITPPELLYGLENDAFVSLGTPDNNTLMGIAEEVQEALREAGAWMSTKQVGEALAQGGSRPGETLLRKVLTMLAEAGEIERIPPVSAGTVPGQTPYWHVREEVASG